MKAVVAAFNQEKALAGAFSVIVQPVVEPMDRFAALLGMQYPTSLSSIALLGAAATHPAPGRQPSLHVWLSSSGPYWDQTLPFCRAFCKSRNKLRERTI